MPFRYKKVLIIGATSGIGRALADRIVDDGSVVIGVGRRQENLEAFASEAKKRGHEVFTTVLDITKLSDIPAFAKDIHAKHPDLDCVILNSGMQRRVDWTKPDEIDLDSMETEMKTNYTAHLHLTKAFLPILQAQAPREAALIYVTSGLALVPMLRCPNYCATKAALHQMILVMRLQLRQAGSNVRVCELLPPAVQTELHDDKHQPDLQGKGNHIGMPLDEFTEEAYKGLNSAENEQVPVGMSRKAFDSWEQERQKQLDEMIARMS